MQAWEASNLPGSPGGGKDPRAHYSSSSAPLSSAARQAGHPKPAPSPSGAKSRRSIQTRITRHFGARSEQPGQHAPVAGPAGDMGPPGARRPGQAVGAQRRDRGAQGERGGDQASVTVDDIWPHEWEGFAAQGRREGSPARRGAARVKQPLPKLAAMLARAEKGEQAASAGQALGVGKGQGAGQKLRVGAGRDAHGASWWCALWFRACLSCMHTHT